MSRTRSGNVIVAAPASTCVGCDRRERPLGKEHGVGEMRQRVHFFRLRLAHDDDRRLGVTRQIAAMA